MSELIVPQKLEIAIIDSDATISSLLHILLDRQGFGCASFLTIEAVVHHLTNNYTYTSLLIIDEGTLVEPMSARLATRLPHQWPHISFILAGNLNELESFANVKVLQKPWAIHKMLDTVDEVFTRKGKTAEPAKLYRPLSLSEW